MRWASARSALAITICRSWSAPTGSKRWTRHCAACAAALADAGAVAVREDVNLEPAFWGQFPATRAIWCAAR
jgi:hypothetical protein